jgi:hypothetical protein
MLQLCFCAADQHVVIQRPDQPFGASRYFRHDFVPGVPFPLHINWDASREFTFSRESVGVHGALCV